MSGLWVTWTSAAGRLAFPLVGGWVMGIGGQQADQQCGAGVVDVHRPQCVLGQSEYVADQLQQRSPPPARRRSSPADDLADVVLRATKRSARVSQ